MTEVLWMGTLLGALFGLFHGVYIYRLILAEGTAGEAATAGRRGKALYYGVWTLGLWVLAGGYLLFFFLLGLLFYLPFKAFR